MYMRGFGQDNLKYVTAEAKEHLQIDRRTRWIDLRAVLLVLAVFAGLSLWAGLKSDGFLEADACTHYQYARWSGFDPHYLLNVWGRPFCTGIYALPAIFAGRTGTKVISLLIALATAVLCWRISKTQEYRWPALACIFFLAGPLTFLESFSVLTELPFALLMAAAFLMYCQRRWWAMAIMVGLMPLARPEGFGFIVLAVIALVLHKRPWWIVLTLIPLIGWDLAGWLSEGAYGPWWRWLPNHWPYASESLYQSGSIAHFVVLLPVVVGPILFPFVLVGIWKNLRHPSVVYGPNHRLRCDALIALMPLAVLAGHSWLYWRGEMASNGEMRYMLVVAPFWALLAGRGWEMVFEKLNWHRPFILAGVAAILPVFANVAYPVVPLRFDPNWQEARKIAQWYESTDLHRQYPRILAAHPGVSYFLDVCPDDPKHMVPWSRRAVDSTPPGVVLIWDDVYSLYNSDDDLVVHRSQINQDGWTLLKTITDGYGHHWAIYLSSPVR